VTLPEGAVVQAIRVDGKDQPPRQDGTKVTLAVHPGRQQVELEWREPAGISLLFRAPAVNLGVPSVNAHVTMHLSRDRWVLFVGGPHAGPAVLFWSLFLIVLLVALGLARVPLTPLKTRHWLLLALGLTQVPVGAAMFVALWLLALGWRQQRGAAIASKRRFDLLQLALAGATLASLAILFTSIERGLLGLPEMQVLGNASDATTLRWFLDRPGATLPRPTLVSVPLLAYRGLMLGWALWLALALVGWLRWGWSAFSEGGWWRTTAPARPVEAPLPPPLPTPPVP
jgi:hypothetical protein